jgi:hypothetical protein
VLAAEAGYESRVNPEVEGGMLIVAPHISAPAGAQLRYEVISSKQGSNGKSKAVRAAA